MDKQLLLHRICKLFHIHHYYENEYGIKEHNKVAFEMKGTSIERVINPNTVYLGFDGLKDVYSLIGIPINKSPHYELMKLLENDKDICNSEYVQREKLGCLDGRYEIKPSNHVMTYKNAKQTIINKSYAPAIIYAINGKYYAFDGKHRLALCCLLGVPCKCKIIDYKILANDAHTQRLYQEMKKRDGYSKNLHLLEYIFM